ncbi:MULTISPECIES: polyprenol monophosphomannose synthase [unclassified Candidatus Cardinium]|uniref:polyprenol monophosphomannose synthase n=1 Tax=unclassified Candidatus Cardinium TaxID=2641185 RepID=UPI001FB2CE22|nr:MULTISPECIES: polyprenol monophosphomannose synthase [unclassified Candidatus Cardinium]
MTTLLRAIVVIPTYNEQANIELLLRAIFGLNIGLNVLVVDDHSPDGTGDVVIKLQKVYPGQLHLLSRPKKEGLGRAYLAGFGWALHYSYDYICSMDGDFSHAPADLPRLLTICTEPSVDMVIGSRYVSGGSVVNWPYTRILLSRMANWLSRFITGLPIQDTTAGFVCYRHSLLKNILNIASVGYSFQIEIKFLAHQHGAKMVEVPITFTNRVRGVSKMNLKIAGESFLRLIDMKWRN